MTSTPQLLTTPWQTYCSIRRAKEAKPFTHCTQCRWSRYNAKRELVCHIPNHRGRTIPNDRLIGWCGFASRHNIADALHPSIIRELGLETNKGK